MPSFSNAQAFLQESYAHKSIEVSTAPLRMDAKWDRFMRQTNLGQGRTYGVTVFSIPVVGDPSRRITNRREPWQTDVASMPEDEG